MIANRRFVFWLVIIVSFAICVILKLNGSSVGMWWTDVLSEPGKPPGLLLFTPQSVRGDEWQIWTPAALSQARQNPRFPIQNLSIGGGRTPLIFNLPVAYYTTFFRPQLWGFFLFDFERGFSFCWCCKVFGLLLASAWLLKQLGCGSRSIILLGTLWIFFSNYVQWWFSSPVMLPEMLASWAVCTGCLLQFFKQSQLSRVAVAFVLFVVSGINFTLCLYPAYQIPLVWLVPVIVVGCWLECRNANGLWMGKRGLLTATAAIAVILLTLVPFWIDVRSTLEMVAHTKYPGTRRSSGGDVSLFKLLSGWVNFFQTTATIPSVYNNICEASNFYILWPTTLFLVIVARLRRISRISPLILSLAVFIICLSAYCVLPMPNVLLRATLLNLVTERRALLSIGIANILLCSFFLDRYPETILRKRGAIIAGILWSCAITALIWKAGRDNPMMFPSRSQMLIASICSVVVAVVFIFGKKPIWSLAILVVLSVATNIRVNPVMSGLGPLLRSQAFQKIDSIRVSDPNAKWIVYYEFIVPELIVATGAKVLNGNKVLPDFDFLHRLDPSGGGDRIYNRYSYIYCEIPKGLAEPSVSQISDTIYVLYLSPNLPVLEDIGCRFVLFPDSGVESELYGFARVYENEKNGIFVYKRL